MENWKNELTKIESYFGYHALRSWEADIDAVWNFMNKYPDDLELNIRVIYILHNILVEENYTKEEEDKMTYLLKTYFDASYNKFSENPEYLFFIGKILYIAEWYFGIDDDLKPIEKKLAFQMQKIAFDKKPDNELYKWAYLHSKNEDKDAFILAEDILNGNTKWLEWLKTKGFAGSYVIESLITSYENYKMLS